MYTLVYGLFSFFPLCMCLNTKLVWIQIQLACLNCLQKHKMQLVQVVWMSHFVKTCNVLNFSSPTYLKYLVKIEKERNKTKQKKLKLSCQNHRNKLKSFKKACLIHCFWLFCYFCLSSFTTYWYWHKKASKIICTFINFNY